MTNEELLRGVERMGYQSIEEFTADLLNIEVDQLDEFMDSYNPPYFD